MLDDKQSGLSPGAHLRAELRRLGFDQVAVATATSVSRQTINNIVNGRQPISRAMAAKLGRLTGRASDYWLREHFPPPHDGEAILGFAEQMVEVRPTSILVNHQLIRAVREGMIGVDPFRVENVQAASLTLTLDDRIVGAQGDDIDIAESREFVLPSRQIIKARSAERIELPLDYVGRMGGIAVLARVGIVILHDLQVHPGFKGKLQFHVLNASPADVRLVGGSPIVSLEIMALATPPRLHVTPGGRTSGNRARHRRW